jgi:hypothetical protein
MRFTISNGKQENASLESLMERGVFDERDIDYLNHLKTDVPDAIATEGVIKAHIYEQAGLYSGTFTETKGWFLGIETKRKYITEICDDVVDWLKDKDADERDLDLDMGSFKTWMKTSENFFWRYVFLLEDSLWNKIESDLRSGDITDLENLYNVDFTKRKNIANKLDSITDIRGLIKVVELYNKRSDKFFELILKRKVKIKMFPFQVILLGAVDLRRTVKKIVNLAL